MNVGFITIIFIEKEFSLPSIKITVPKTAQKTAKGKRLGLLNFQIVNLLYFESTFRIYNRKLVPLSWQIFSFSLF